MSCAMILTLRKIPALKAWKSLVYFVPVDIAVILSNVVGRGPTWNNCARRWWNIQLTYLIVMRIRQWLHVYGSVLLVFGHIESYFRSYEVVGAISLFTRPQVICCNCQFLHTRKVWSALKNSPIKFAQLSLKALMEFRIKLSGFVWLMTQCARQSSLMMKRLSLILSGHSLLKGRTGSCSKC